MKPAALWGLGAALCASMAYAGLAERIDGQVDEVRRVATSGTSAIRTDYAATRFDRVLVDSPYKVEIRVGGARNVAAYGTDAALRGLALSVVGDELRIRRSSDGPAGDGRLRIVVTMPALDGVQLYGAGNMRVDRVRASEFHAVAAGSGRLHLTGMIADEADLTAIGPARIVATGTIGRLSTAPLRGGGIDTTGLVTPASAP